MAREINTKKTVEISRLISAIVITFNVVIIIAVIVVGAIYNNYLEKHQLESQYKKMDLVTDSLTTRIDTYLQGKQELIQVVADDITNGDYTIEQAGEQIREIADLNYIDSSIAIIYAPDETKNQDIQDKWYTGYSSRLNPENTYKYDYFASKDYKELFEDKTGNERYHVTSMFNAPISGVNSVALYTEAVVNDGGEKHSVYIVFVLAKSVLDNLGILKLQVTGAKSLVIHQDGHYIYTLDEFSIRGSDFFDYILINNDDFSYNDELKLKQQMKTIGKGSFTKLNNKGESTYYVYKVLNTDSNLIAVSYITIDDLKSGVSTNLTILFVTIGVVALMVILDIVYFIMTNILQKRLKTASDRSNKAKSELVNYLTHEVRTPVSTIMGVSDIAKVNIDNKEQLKQSLGKIKKASSNILITMNEILDISRIESNTLTLTPVNFSISSLAESVVDYVQPLLKEKAINFEIYVNNFEQEYFHADRARITQIITTILSNATKYSYEEGNISLTMLQSKGKDENHSHLRIEIKDNGYGIEEGLEDKIYEPFSELPSDVRGIDRGVSLSLAIVKRLLKMMGGKISYESRIGVGTTFIVEMDLENATTNEEIVPLDNIRALIVDDDNDVLSSYKPMMEACGLRADFANNANQALDMIKLAKADGDRYLYIILDYKMPDISGIELAKEIRKIVKNDVKILLMSAYDVTSVEEDGKKAGIDGFIMKPLFTSTLLSKIRKIERNQNADVDSKTILNGLRVLVADYVDEEYDIIASMLVDMNMSVERAENGLVALKKVRDNHNYDLVLLDIYMPVMNGVDTTYAIRGIDTDYANSLPIIAMARNAFAQNIMQAYEAGITTHIVKPINMNKLVKVIKKCLQI